MKDADPIYTRDEAGRVLDRVFANRKAGEGISDALFREAVHELGITEGELDLAVGQVVAGRQSEATRRDAIRYKWIAYTERLAMGLSALAAVFCLNAITGEPWWAHWAALGWGLWIALDGWRTFASVSAGNRKAAE